MLKGAGTNRLSLQIYGPLTFVIQHELFLYRTG